MILYGFGGLLGSGKDTAADALVRDRGFIKMGMSDPLHTVMLTLDPLIGFDAAGEPIRYADLIERFGYVEAKKIPEVRRLLQVMGTEVGRQMIDPDVWVKMAERALEYGPSAAVVTGIRFPNEVEMIKRLGGITVWIERPDVTMQQASHPSEQSVHWKDFDVQIMNDSTIEALEEFIVAWSDHAVAARR